jgi:hypothetical protein
MGDWRDASHLHCRIRSLRQSCLLRHRGRIPFDVSLV